MEKKIDTKELTLSLESGLFIIPFQYNSIIGSKYVSPDQYYFVQFNFNIIDLLGLGDSQYCISIIIVVSTENLHVNVKFIYSKLSTPSLKWPSYDDLCWLSNVHACRVVFPPELSSETARKYYFNTSEFDKIEKKTIYFS